MALTAWNTFLQQTLLIQLPYQENMLRCIPFQVYSWKAIHLFSLAFGQSSKLFEHRSKTRHRTPRLVQSDWRICKTNRRHSVWIRHWAKLQHCAGRIAHLQNCSAFILNSSSLLTSYWTFFITPCVNSGISQNCSSKCKKQLVGFEWGMYNEHGLEV